MSWTRFRTTPALPRYFAFGSNMNPERVRERGLAVRRIERARLPGFRLAFDKRGRGQHGGAHASLVWDPEEAVEGLLYLLATPGEIEKMDPFERAPVNYSREIVTVVAASGHRAAWTYIANPAVVVPGGRPERAYLDHLLAGRRWLSADYHARLAAWSPADGEP